MNTFPLNDHWTVEYFEPNIDGFEMAPSVQEIPRLPEWKCAGRFAESGFYAWLQRPFELVMTDYCVRYVVQVEHAPRTTKIYVNDRHLADCTEDMQRVDITDAVSLGKNRLSLRVDCVNDAQQQFESILLLQMFCDK